MTWAQGQGRRIEWARLASVRGPTAEEGGERGQRGRLADRAAPGVAPSAPSAESLRFLRSLPLFAHERERGGAAKRGGAMQRFAEYGRKGRRSSLFHRKERKGRKATAPLPLLPLLGVLEVSLRFSRGRGKRLPPASAVCYPVFIRRA